ncbi:hypothetical protein [Streptomyces sp. YIM B13518]|uniref:hypothetical protein n=1 Tax=Streptomyces sp. YIM B13518 TaxID=3366316 RepID=UPI00368C1DB8
MQAVDAHWVARERVPYDLGVTGLDAVPAVAGTDPPLTTVGQPVAGAAASATEPAPNSLRPRPGRVRGPQVGPAIRTTLTTRDTAPPNRAWGFEGVVRAPCRQCR